MCKGLVKSCLKRCPPRRGQLIFSWDQGLFPCWLLASNAPNELLERVRVGYTEIHAVPVLQRPRQFRGCGGRTQDGRNNGTFPLHELAEKRLHLLVLPGADTTVTDKNRR